MLTARNSFSSSCSTVTKKKNEKGKYFITKSRKVKLVISRWEATDYSNSQELTSYVSYSQDDVETEGLQATLANQALAW